MKVAVYSTHSFDKPFLMAANQHLSSQHELVFFDEKLTTQTALNAKGFDAVCCFVIDDLSEAVLTLLAQQNITLIALRSAGFNHVDLSVAKKLGLTVVRVPAYSPNSVAEFTVGLILALNRKIPQAYNRVREHNFLLDGLLGFDLKNKTVGVVGTGNIGRVFVQIMLGFGCKVIASDPVINPLCVEKGVQYMDFAELCEKADIISLHCPLNNHTKHMINKACLAKMKKGVMLINTGRGALIDTAAVIEALNKQHIGYLGLDVYEGEENLFFRDHSKTPIDDEIFKLLQTFPNVVITGHQAFFTEEAITNISNTTMKNIHDFEKGQLDPTVVL